MNNKRRITGLLAALILAIVGTIALMGYVRSAKNDAVAQEALVDVYVVDKLVPKGAESGTIKSSVSLAHVPTRLKQPGAITNLEAVGTNVAATDLEPGDQLLEARLVPKDKVSDDVTDKVQLSALLEPERAVGGSLQKGDLVGVYLSFDPFDMEAAGQSTQTAAVIAVPASGSADTTPTTQATKSPNISRLEFQHVLVTNVQTISTPVSTDSKDKTGVVQVTGAQYVITLALSPEQSERFVFATEFGHIRLSKDPATVSDDGTRRITLGNVYTVVK